MGLLGGAFDPPHIGHVALADAAERALGLERIVIVVVADPGHKDVHAHAGTRLELARLAFPGREVVLDHHARQPGSRRAAHHVADDLPGVGLRGRALRRERADQRVGGGRRGGEPEPGQDQQRAEHGHRVGQRHRRQAGHQHAGGRQEAHVGRPLPVVAAVPEPTGE